MLNKDTLEDEIFLVQTVYSKGYFNKALELTSNLIKKYPKNYFIQNLHGVVLIALNNWKISKKYFLNSIKINNNFAEGYNNLGLYEFNLGDINKYPKMRDAILDRDWDSALYQFERYYTDNKTGDSKVLEYRNQGTYDHFLSHRFETGGSFTEEEYWETQESSE